MKYFLLFIASFIIFLIHSYVAGHGIYGDGNGYYAYAHALYFEKNLDFDPIYSHLANFLGRKDVFSRIFWETTEGPFEVARNPFTIGTAIFWLPFLFFIDLTGEFFGLGLGKFDSLYEIGPGIAGIFYLVFGLFFLEKYLANFFPKKVVNLTFWSVVLATNVVYYISFEPALSHQVSFFLISSLLWKTFSPVKTKLEFFVIGLASGLLLITRMADVVLLIPVFWQMRKSFKLKDLLAILTGFSIGLTPQIINQYLMFGNALINPYFRGEIGIFSFSLFNILASLFSPSRGLLLWSPILILAIIGLVRSRSKILLITLFAFLILASSWSARQSAGFSQRLYFSANIYLAFGLVAFLQKLKRKPAIILVSFFTVWNILLLNQFFVDSERLVKDKGLTFGNFITGQFTTPIKLLETV